VKRQHKHHHKIKAGTKADSGKLIVRSVGFISGALGLINGGDGACLWGIVPKFNKENVILCLQNRFASIG